jgi:GR25 family glycosyltransferase involved in LPS biosynthesis
MIKCSDNSNVWDCFDKIYCISVEERTDRRDEADRQFASVGLTGRVEYFIVRKHPQDTEQGIFESHIRCIEKGLAEGAGTIAIFEDDIVFERFDPVRLKEAVEYTAGRKDWGLLCLGCLVSRNTRTDNRSVLGIRYRSLTHGYVISRDFAEVVIRQSWKGVAYDEMLRTVQRNCFAVYPSFAFQSNSATDNDKYLTLDRFRRAMGGLRRIQKMNEFYHLNKTVIIAAHAVVIGMAIGLLMMR